MAKSEDFRSDGHHHQHRRILLGVTGSVAAVKAPEIAVRLSRELNAQIRILLTSGGHNFWDKAHAYDARSWEQLQRSLKQGDGQFVIHEAQEEWRDWKRLGDPVLHIELRNWAEVFVIAPLSAHSLAKLSNGFCDETLSCVARAWKYDPAQPMILAPAMNTAMWEHPLTQQQLLTVQNFATTTGAVMVVPPQVKTLACGEIGDGALASVDDIIETVRIALEKSSSVDSSSLA